jgi:hypothetical protein
VHLRDRARYSFLDLIGVFTFDAIGHRYPDRLTGEDLSLTSLS